MKSWMDARWARVGLAVVVIAAVLLFTVNWILPPLAMGAANWALPRMLNTPRAGVRDLDLALLRGRVGIGGLRIAQPPGFGEGWLLNAPVIRADAGTCALLGGRLVVQNVLVDGLTLNIVRNGDGVLNLTALAKAAPAEALGAESQAPTTPSAPTASPAPGTIETAAPPPAAPPPALTLKRVRLKDLHITYTDEALGAAPMRIVVSPLNVTLSDLVIDAERASERTLPGRLVLTATIQQGDRPDSLLGVAARVGIVGTNVPAVNAVVRLCGLELATFAPAVPAAVAPTIGGDSLDLTVDASVAADVLDCKGVLTTWGGRLSGGLSGTPDAPRVEGTGALLGALGFTGGRLGGKLMDAGQTGWGTAEAAVGATFTLGKGAGKTLGALGGGLFKTARQAARGDMKGAAGGLVDTAKDTVSETHDAVLDTGRSAVDGVVEAAGKAAGRDAAETWRSDIGERWAQQWQAALDELEQRPYPNPKD